MSRLPLMICDRRFDGTPSFAASLRADMSSSFSSSSRISPGWIGVRAILFLLLLVVIDNLDVLRSCCIARPFKADAPLPVDTDGMLPFPACLERFQPI